MRCKLGVLALAIVGLAAMGCRVQINKDENGDEKDVRVATPLGGIDVKTNQTSATDVGLPQYPGSELSRGQKSDKSANVSLGFGGWQLRVKVANYTSSDSQQKVVAFYRKALGSYGDVIECDGGRPVGTPLITRDGLTCDASGADEKDLRFHKDELQLRAGSRHHQHLVVFKNAPGEATEFSLIELELRQKQIPPLRSG